MELNWKPSFYATFLHEIKQIALKYGYAIGVHGSMARDLDIIAVPWDETVKDEYRMIIEICDAIGGRVRGIEVFDKPHGRKAYMIPFNDLYLDISVFPPK